MKYIIMCGGRYEKWTEPRQMTPICGEPIVSRTIRLLREEGVADIAISTSDKRFERFGVPLLSHANQMIVSGPDVITGAWVDAFYPMTEPACYLMGDVVFSPQAIRCIVRTDKGNVQFFASCPEFSPLYIKEYAEPFAFKVYDQARFRAAIDFVRANVNTGIFGRHPIAWELWQVLNGWNVNDINYGSYNVINDYTCDVDTPADAVRIEGVIGECGL